MKNLVLDIIQKMVDYPDQVVITEVNTPEGKTILDIRVSAQDIAKVIGKDGRFFKALRTVVTVMGPGGVDIVLDSPKN